MLGSVMKLQINVSKSRSYFESRNSFKKKRKKSLAGSIFRVVAMLMLNCCLEPEKPWVHLGSISTPYPSNNATLPAVHHKSVVYGVDLYAVFPQTSQHFSWFQPENQARIRSNDDKMWKLNIAQYDASSPIKWICENKYGIKTCIIMPVGFSFSFFFSLFLFKLPLTPFPHTLLKLLLLHITDNGWFREKH